MKKTVLILILASLGVMLAGQSRTELLKQRLEGHRVTFNFSCTTTDKVPVKQSGTAVIDGDCYVLRSSGLEVFCDGTTRWTVDRESKEVYVELSGGTRDFLADPAAYLDKVRDLEIGESTVSGVFNDPSQDKDIKFKFSAIRTAPLSGSTEGFSFNTAALGSEWIVTDLR